MRVVAIAVAATASQTAIAEPAMWVIRDNDSTIYLIGTVHLLRPDTVWKSEKVMKTVADSTELWLEIANPDDQAAVMPLVQKYAFDREKSLSSKLPPPQREKLSKVAAQYNMPVAALDVMKPWMAALTFIMLPLQKSGFDANSGVDHVLRAQAEKEGDKVAGFESLEDQIRMMAELPEKDQTALLASTLDDAASGIALIDRIANAWTAGNTKQLAELMVNDMKTEAPSVYEKLLVQRNVRWCAQVDQILKRSGVQEIAVGAAHLVGPDSLQVQLAKRGIRAEPY